MLPFYLDQAIMDKEVMDWPRVTKENKRSGFTYSMPPISQWSAPMQMPGLGPNLEKRDQTPSSLEDKEDEGEEDVDTERGVNQYQVQFKTFFNLYLNHSTISNEK
jgi:hypothetical protein